MPCVDRQGSGRQSLNRVHPKTLTVAIALAVSASALVPRLRAQDVTVTPLEWVEPEDAPDQLPVENHPLRPKLPEDLRNLRDPEYVVVEIYTDDKGKRRMFRVIGTLPGLEDVASKLSAGWKHTPGRRKGRAVNTLTRCAVIYNPASAAVDTPDATPRLLAVRVVMLPAQKRKDGEPCIRPDVLWATVSLNAAGVPTALTGAPPALSPLLEKNIREWRFAPARKGGQPVAAELRVPFVFSEEPDESINLKGKDTPPRVVTQPAPEYPRQLRDSGFRGDVLVDFVVDREGRVIRAHVVRSLNPAFDEPALAAVRRWKFEPGRKDGVAVNVHLQVPIGFRLEGEWDGGSSGLSVKHKVKQSDLPEEWRYDVAPKPRGRVQPVYPYELLRDHVSGDATVGFVISETGKIIGSSLVKASRPEFGAAALAMIEQWEFEPALRGGRPTKCQFGFKQDFSPYDTEIVSEKTEELMKLERKSPGRIVGAGSLDKRLKPVVMVSPGYPRSLGAEVEHGEATVEALVDEEGQVRLPRVVSATAPAFGWAAVQAVSGWRFDPPTQKGAAVVTRVRIPFEFQIKADEAAELKK